MVEYKVSRLNMALRLLLTPVIYLYATLQYVFGDSSYMSFQGMLKELTDDFKQANVYVVTGKESVDRSEELARYDFMKFFENNGYPDLTGIDRLNIINTRVQNKALWIK